jgi:hypothetical protein
VAAAGFGEKPIKKLEELTSDILVSIEAEMGAKFIKQNTIKKLKLVI